jgi:hypothetical protein
LTEVKFEHHVSIKTSSVNLTESLFSHCMKSTVTAQPIYFQLSETTTSVTTSDVHVVSREFRDSELGQLTVGTVGTVTCPDAEPSPEIH